MRQRSVASGNRGEVLLAQGKIADALQAYGQARDIDV
jgi:hypothetical protein